MSALALVLLALGLVCGVNGNKTVIHSPLVINGTKEAILEFQVRRELGAGCAALGVGVRRIAATHCRVERNARRMRARARGARSPPPSLLPTLTPSPVSTQTERLGVVTPLGVLGMQMSPDGSQFVIVLPHGMSASALLVVDSDGDVNVTSGDLYVEGGVVRTSDVIIDGIGSMWSVTSGLIAGITALGIFQAVTLCHLMSITSAVTPPKEPKSGSRKAAPPMP